jgi:hypothetical protein
MEISDALEPQGEAKVSKEDRKEEKKRFNGRESRWIGTLRARQRRETAKR